MLRKLHTVFGLTAGTVLAVIALTGSLMALQPQILRALNPIVFDRPASGMLLSAVDLHRVARRQYPDQRIQALTLSTEPDQPAIITLAVPGKPRGKAILVNPYTGVPLPPPRGTQAFQRIEDLHRELLLGEAGARVTASAVTLVPLLLVTGLLLRLRRWPGWRGWFLPRAASRGRGRTWQRHAVLGSWLSLTLVFSAGTGLWWSYDAWKQGLQRLLDVEMGAKPMAAGGSLVGSTMLITHLDAALPQLATQLPKTYRSLRIDLDRMGQGQGLVIEYVTVDAPHERARNTLVVSAAGDLVKHVRYADIPYGQQLGSAWKLVHTGQFWGLPGQVLLLVSSLGTVLLFGLGLRLFLTRAR